MKTLDLTNVQESGDNQRPAPGGYVCQIVKVEDIPLDPKTDKGNYLRIHYDITEGDFAGYYAGLRERFPESSTIGSYIRSYKEKALGMFKRFCSVVSNSNGNYVFDAKTNSDEQTLVGKKVGLVLGEEEYYSNAGELKTRLYVVREYTVDDIHGGKFKTPDLKKLNQDNDGFVSTIAPGTNEEVPF